MKSCLVFQGTDKVRQASFVFCGMKQVHKRLWKPFFFSLFWRWTLTKCDLVTVNLEMVATSIDIFPCIFPWKKLVYDGHKVWTVMERRISFCLLGCRIQPGKKSRRRRTWKAEIQKQQLKRSPLNLHLYASHDF